MALVLTGKGTITGTVTNVDVNIRYNVDEQGVDSLIDTICDRKEDVAECVLEADVDICSSPQTEQLTEVIRQGFINPCASPNPGSPCDFNIAGSFAASIAAGLGSVLLIPCAVPVPPVVGPSINGQPTVPICGEVFGEFRASVEIYSTNILGAVAEILQSVCAQKDRIGLNSRGSIDNCILSQVYPLFQDAVQSNIAAVLESAAQVLESICYGQINLNSSFACLEVSAAGNALGNAAASFACFVASEIANAVEQGGTITVCGQTCGVNNSCNMAKGLITNCNLACYAFEQLINQDCFQNYINQYLEENRCTILETLLPNEASCADSHVLDWFARALDRQEEKKCTIFNKFIAEDGSTKECITNSIVAWLGKDENPCKVMEAVFGKIGVTEKAKTDDSCVNNYIVDYVDAQTNDLLYSIFTNNNNSSQYSGRGAQTSGNKGYKKNLRNGILNFVQDETCAIFAALTNGLQGKATLQDFIDAGTAGDWYTFYFLGQGATADKCVNEFDNFIDAVFCRVAKKIVDRANANSCPSGDNSDCIIEVARALYGLIIANFGVPGTFSVEGECKQAKFLVDLKDDFVQDNAFCSAPTKDDIKYIT